MTPLANGKLYNEKRSSTFGVDKVYRQQPTARLSMTRTRLFLLTAALLLWPLLAGAQFAATVSPPKVTGSKAVVKLGMKNGFTQKVESARAVVFLLDDQGKMVGQATRWVIGGTKDRPALEPGKETVFNFVVSFDKFITATNLTAKVSFNCLILDGGRLLDPVKNVVIKTSKKD